MSTALCFCYFIREYEDANDMWDQEKCFNCIKEDTINFKAKNKKIEEQKIKNKQLFKKILYEIESNFIIYSNDNPI